MSTMDGEEGGSDSSPQLDQQPQEAASAASTLSESPGGRDNGTPASEAPSSLLNQHHVMENDSTRHPHTDAPPPPSAANSGSEPHTKNAAINSNQSTQSTPTAQQTFASHAKSEDLQFGGEFSNSSESAGPESEPISVVLETAAELGTTIPVPRPSSAMSDESSSSLPGEAGPGTNPSQSGGEEEGDTRPSCLSPLPGSTPPTEPPGLERCGGGGPPGQQSANEEGSLPEGRVESPASQASTDDRQLEQFSEVLLDSDLSPSDSEAMVGAAGGNGSVAERKRVRFADQLEDQQATSPSGHHGARSPPPKLPLAAGGNKHPGVPVNASPTSPRQPLSPLTPVHSAEELIAGVEYPAEYLGSTPVLFGSGGAQCARMYQAQQAVKLIKDPEAESRPHCTVTIKISTRGIKIADTNTNVDLMVHPLHTISYVADIESVLVVMAHKIPPSIPSPSTPVPQPTPTTPTTPTSPEPAATTKMTCHVLDTPDARQVAVVIGQAFSTAYKEFLKGHGISEEALEEEEYKHILNAQSVSPKEVESLSDRNKTKKLTIAKHRGEAMGLMVMVSGYGSAIPACVIIHISKTGAATRSGLLNIGDNIISLNGVSLVGMPIKTCNENIKKCRAMNVVKMEVVSCPAVVEVNIVRPDLRYKLGFNVHEDVICSLMRGSIAERCGVRVGHKIIEINGTSTVGMKHADIVHLLTSTVGDLHMRTMPHLMYQLLTGQVQPVYH